jgi:hypothetical protein
VSYNTALDDRRLRPSTLPRVPRHGRWSATARRRRRPVTPAFCRWSRRAGGVGSPPTNIWAVAWAPVSATQRRRGA